MGIILVSSSVMGKCLQVKPSCTMKPQKSELKTK